MCSASADCDCDAEQKSASGGCCWLRVGAAGAPGARSGRGGQECERVLRVQLVRRRVEHVQREGQWEGEWERRGRGAHSGARELICSAFKERTGALSGWRVGRMGRREWRANVKLGLLLLVVSGGEDHCQC